MNVSGTLHFYSGEDRELFFVFDDDVAQQLYRTPEFDVDDLETRRAYISVGSNRFIHRRALSFSRKQTEIKVSLCSRATKDGLGSLTALYNWFSARGRPRPKPFEVLGTFSKVRRQGEHLWELRITEPADLVAPPGLARRRKVRSRQRTSYEHRRRILQRDLAEIGGPAEELALALAVKDFRGPTYACLWRREFLDSERIEIRRMGIIADIDVWDTRHERPHVFIEVKAQKVLRPDPDPAFYLSLGEWRSYQRARQARIDYQVWLFQYRHIHEFRTPRSKLDLIVFRHLSPEWLDPDGYIVRPESTVGQSYQITV